jgi:hypothetical protein
MCRRPGQMAVSLLPACNLSPLAADSVMQITQPPRHRSNTNSRPRYVVNCQNNYITFCARSAAARVRLCWESGAKSDKRMEKGACAGCQEFLCASFSGFAENSFGRRHWVQNAISIKLTNDACSCLNLASEMIRAVDFSLFLGDLVDFF